LTNEIDVRVPITVDLEPSPEAADIDKATDHADGPARYLPQELLVLPESPADDYRLTGRAA
jgi:hypothetical protein